MKQQITDNRIWFGRDGNGVPRTKKFLSEVTAGLTPSTLWLAEEVGTNDAAKKETIKLFKGQAVFETPKPETLIERILHISSNAGDIILDSFLGSGTTAAVAGKMNRRYIGIEMGNHAVTHCQPRLKKVVDGEQSGVSEAQNWLGGGGFRFYRLGANAFDEDGRICPEIRFSVLAAHLWFSETNSPWNGTGDSPALGIYDGKAYALLYNGILGDKRPDSGNVVTSRTLQSIRDEISKIEKDFTGPVVIYGESSRIGDTRLRRENVIFKQTPYDVKVR